MVQAPEFTVIVPLLTIPAFWLITHGTEVSTTTEQPLFIVKRGFVVATTRTLLITQLRNLNLYIYWR